MPQKLFICLNINVKNKKADFKEKNRKQFFHLFFFKHAKPDTIADHFAEKLY